MKELLLIIVLLAIFILVYYAMRKLDDLMVESHRLAAGGNKGSRAQIRIAAEKPYLLETVGPAWESCSTANPYLEFLFSSGKSRHLLRKLQDGSVDIALLSEKSSENLSPEYTAVQVSNQAVCPAAASAVPVEGEGGGDPVYAVWNQKIKSKDRDRVLFALENECCREKHGYRDYLD